jgi:tight adherence protein C
MLIAVATLLFVAITVVTVALLSSTRAAETNVRLQDVRHESTGTAVVVRGTGLDHELGRWVGDRLVRPRVGQFLDWFVGLAPTKAIERGRRKLEQAGKTRLSDLSLFLLAKVTTLGLFVALGAWALSNLPQPLPIRMASAGLFCLFGLIVPDYALTKMVQARQFAIRRELPDVLDLLVVSTEAGAGLDAAMTAIIERKRGPLADEFSRFLSEVHFGKSRERAWNDMAERVGLQELSTVISAILQADKLGVSIAKTLRNQAAALRQRRSQQVREIIAKMPVKMLFPVVLCIFPALFVVILAPGLIAIADTFAAIR